MDELFEMFWKAKPKRLGDNPKKKAQEKFLRLVASGTDPQKIITAARSWAMQHPQPTPYVPMAITWLNQERFNDIEQKADCSISFYPDLEKQANAKGWFWDNDAGRWVQRTKLEQPLAGHETGQGAE